MGFLVLASCRTLQKPREEGMRSCCNYFIFGDGDGGEGFFTCIYQGIHSRSHHSAVRGIDAVQVQEHHFKSDIILHPE